MINQKSLACLHPELAKEWHLTKNGDSTPDDISAGSGKKVWWRCEKSHEWLATISNRTRNRSGCPYCSGKKAWPGFNDLKTINPGLASEWHPSKNDELAPNNVVAHSDKKVWWLCKKGHEWMAVIKDRQNGNGCPYCSGRLPIPGETDLATVFPDIAKEWHSIKNGDLMPTQVTSRSNKKVWWQCKEGHEWYATVDSRSRTICPICTNRKILVGHNDLATTHPTIAAQWHPAKNGKLTPKMITYGSLKSVWWLCKKGHEWKVSPNARTNHENGSLTNCPICSSELRTSFPEQAIFYYLCTVTTAESRNTAYGKELDIWLPELQVGIEYNGIYYHTDSRRDVEKISFFKEKNIRIITIMESKRNFVSSGVIEYDYKKAKQLDWAISELFEQLGYIPPDINTERDALRIQEQYVRMEKENSIAVKFSQISNEWHPSKNGRLKPEMFSFSSHAKVWWLGKCGHEWSQTIKNRTLANSGCPICSGKEVSSGFNDLATKNPEVILLWHPTKNGELTPTQVTPQSGKKVWWQCKRGHEWLATISCVSNGSRCPICSNHKIMIGVNDLGTTHPELANEWHPTKNGEITPQQVTYGNDKKFWWKCAESHEWQASPNSRTNSKAGCPYCSNKKILPGYNDLWTTNPDIARQWNFDRNGELQPQYVSVGSSKKVWWLGDCGHEWEMTVRNRITGQNCPYCSGKKILAGFNDLATNYPDLVKEWHPNKNNIEPSEITRGSNAKVWWKCAKGHEWEAIVANRSKGAGCPKCYRDSRGAN